MTGELNKSSLFPIMTTLNPSIKLALLKRKNAKSALAKGFTLIELVITIAIIGILTGIALPRFLNQSAKAETAAGNAWAYANARACAVLIAAGNTLTDFEAEAGPNGGTAPTTCAADTTFTGDSTVDPKSYKVLAGGDIDS